MASEFGEASAQLEDRRGGDPAQAWAILAAVFVTTMAVVGSTNYSFGALVKPVGADLGLNRASVNTGMILVLLGSGLIDPVIGRLIDRVPVRVMMVAGALLYSSGLAVISNTRDLWLISAMLVGPVAWGLVAMGALIASTVVARWFRRRRGLALGILAAATSAGGLIVVPTFVWSITTFGWRRALLMQGIGVAALVILLALLVVRDRPRADQPPTADAADDRRWTFGALLRTRNFWLVGFAASLLIGTDGALLASLVPYASDHGMTPGQGGLLVSCLTGSAVIGKLTIAALSDRSDKRVLLCIIAGFNACFLTVLMIAPPFGILLAICCVMGLAIGGTLPVYYALVAELFGARSFGTVLGTMGPITLLLSTSSMRFVGEIYDRYGNYDRAFTTFLCGAALAALLILSIRRSPTAPSLPDEVGVRRLRQAPG